MALRSEPASGLPLSPLSAEVVTRKVLGVQRSSSTSKDGCANRPLLLEGLQNRPTWCSQRVNAMGNLPFVWPAIQGERHPASAQTERSGMVSGVVDLSRPSIVVED